MPCWIFPLKQETLIDPAPKKKKKNQKKLKMQLQVNLVVQVGQNSPHYKISNHSNKSFDKEKYQTKKEKEKES